MIIKQLFQQILDESEFIGDMTIPLNPVVAPRPRVTAYGVFYPKKYSTWKQLVRQKCPSGQIRSADPLLVLVTHVVKKPKKPSKQYPHGDIDNFDKAALDGVTSLNGYWQDDAQIVTLMSIKRYAKPGEEPSTNIEFYKMKEDRL